MVAYNRAMVRAQRVVELVVEDDRVVGQAGGFLAIRRMRLRNRRADGSMSRSYGCDFVVRPTGVDAVAVAVFRRAGGATQVLLRDGLRPALAFGRGAADPPVADTREYRYLREICAGVIERADRGEQGVRARAAIEVREEAGYVVRAADVILLGAGMFPTPGSMAERVWLAAVPLAPDAEGLEPTGDGSPMEEGASTVWMDLADAIASCVAGDIEDAKTELCLRRLADHLARATAAPGRARPSR